ncbi:polysaccharide deacetylase family protein [Streptomyces himalayensis]|uniref:Polysaccharide deacetylase family protein n=1 Tax=Streptomyces himalayensis subsp. himalayensis TaxID=2756131 RepID=A0A7W0IDY7_9ACTN|nr:polysaccharide deacetylase family protein [Streptomyces himalayensis]MBA2951531.1 polysaccharide deacetylase family protein [Streptomyces himalayensis subsp. himalayensis]
MPVDTASRDAAPLAPAPPTPHPQPWILLYHSVGDPADDPYGITVAPERLEHQLRWLRRRGLTGVGVGTLMRARAAGRARGLVGLTFDDGYTDFIDHALPLLQRHDFTATVFVLPGRLGGDNAWDLLGPRRPLLTAAGIRAVAAAGMEIGSHGRYHLDLTAVTVDELRKETRGSLERLRQITGVAPQGFCYPYGAVDQRAVEAVRDAGYAYACAITPGPLGSDHALPRTHISHADRGLRLRTKRLRHRFRQLTRGDLR